MNFKGLQKSSFIDYPDKICTVLFTGGCNFRCPFCHNSLLVKNEGEIILERDVLEFLESRKTMIEAVCISGGEPTLQKELVSFIKKVKDIGYLVKLDTNGTNPDVIKRLLDLRLVDYIAMDIKAPFSKYSSVVGVMVDINSIQESIRLIKNSDIDYEFRTTVCKELLSQNDILELSKEISGAKRYIIQNFKDRETVLAGQGRFTPYLREELLEIEKEIKDLFGEIKIRF
ncbi:pyruvate formate lyase activating enzyme [Caloranaerobacter azorensis DSM 13643]|uniref:Pyruvate formate lyase activating enzyme n=1 Tax=Caloranaerobacter azorensis DSM 13643 TaxID=1121264 RepID=A0A1M5T2F3_9FIRM|nr:anaerobic ribonucleoside-triphosphate reductase activating protein [Caloranaerobacter azorensis]SHH44939.1 pyruvate formate lyase activating enzyme [Caloranaerobacter azorensis DSM 13643]